LNKRLNFLLPPHPQILSRTFSTASVERFVGQRPAFSIADLNAHLALAPCHDFRLQFRGMLDGSGIRRELL